MTHKEEFTLIEAQVSQMWSYLFFVFKLFNSLHEYCINPSPNQISSTFEPDFVFSYQEATKNDEMLAFIWGPNIKIAVYYPLDLYKKEVSEATFKEGRGVVNHQDIEHARSTLLRDIGDSLEVHLRQQYFMPIRERE